MQKTNRKPGIHLHKTTVSRMAPEQYVKQFYPDAFCDYSKRYKAFAVAVETEGEQIIIGKSEFFERIAWKNAKDWIKVQETKNPKPQ